MRVGEGFLNAEQGKSIAKVCPLVVGWASSRSSVALDVPRLQAFIGVFGDGGNPSWKAGLCLINSSQ
jgi:hypothetical protein